MQSVKWRWMGGLGLLLAVSVGCSSNSGNDFGDGGGGGSCSGGDAGACSSVVPDAGACTATASSMCMTPKMGQTCMTTVDAKVVDTSGSGIGGLTVFVCGTDLCTNPGKTLCDGTIHLPGCIDLASPAFKMFDDPGADFPSSKGYAPFAALLTGGPSYTLNDVTVVPLPECGSALTGAATSGGATLTLGGAPKFDFSHSEDYQKQFRAVEVDVTKLPSALSGSTPGVQLAWGLAPLNTTLSPAAQLSVPNSMHWAAGAAVDVYLNGTDVVNLPGTMKPAAPWGQWGPIGTAHVSSDGMTVTTDTGSGNGIPEISMVGFKLH